jgi:predicted DNA-binding transcriptional regulator YafY
MSQKKVREISDAVVSVWDLTAQAWRSFRYDRMNNAEILEIYKEEWFRYDDNG